MEKDEIIESFIQSIKDNQNDEHFLKLFDKTGQDVLKLEGDNDEWLRELKLRISCFFQEALKLNTVSFLFGTGTSMPLGSERIYEMPKSICEDIKNKKLDKVCSKLVSCYKNRKCDKNAGCKINLERFLGDIVHLSRTQKLFKDIMRFSEEIAIAINDLDELIKVIKQSLHKICNVPNYGKIDNDFYKKDALNVHKEFIKKVLARPLNLRRVNIFTTNYDLAFEQAMDDLGVLYIDGFVGTVKRVFKPESYNYDYYFPASTTEGNVHRLDKVVHLYKLHGSLNWIETKPDEKNIFGIEQVKEVTDYKDSILIYPQPMKEEETLGFPYSEIFRRFAAIIQQPQNVLFTFGYGFGDEHINRVIYNALSISTFHLVIVSFGWTPKLREFYSKVKDDSRVSFLIGKYLGDWRNFVYYLLPDIKQLELEERIMKTMSRLKGISGDEQKQSE